MELMGRKRVGPSYPSCTAQDLHAKKILATELSCDNLRAGKRVCVYGIAADFNPPHSLSAAEVANPRYAFVAPMVATRESHETPQTHRSAWA